MFHSAAAGRTADSPRYRFGFHSRGGHCWHRSPHWSQDADNDFPLTFRGLSLSLVHFLCLDFFFFYCCHYFLSSQRKPPKERQWEEGNASYDTVPVVSKELHQGNLCLASWWPQCLREYLSLMPASDSNCSWLGWIFSHCKVNYKLLTNCFGRRASIGWLFLLGFLCHLSLWLILVSDPMFSLVELVLKIFRVQ